MWWAGGGAPTVEPATGTVVVEVDRKAKGRIKDCRLVLTGSDGEAYTLGPGEWNREVAERIQGAVGGADGLRVAPTRLTLTVGGSETVRLTSVPEVPMKESPRDREAAKFALSLGGSVWIKGDPWIEVKTVAGLPAGPSNSPDPDW